MRLARTLSTETCNFMMEATPEGHVIVRTQVDAASSHTGGTSKGKHHAREADTNYSTVIVRAQRIECGEMFDH